MARVLITGGCGFIGSHLFDRLLADGHDVTLLDNLVTGRLENLHHSYAIENIDIRSVDQRQLLGIDWVFHLAARSDIVASIEHPLVYHDVNVNGTIALLEAARKAGVKRFIYAASGSCYGIAKNLPTPEIAAIRPMYPYALTKWVAEQYVLHWGQIYGLPVISLRLSNVYGPRARRDNAYGAVMGVFLAQAANNQPLTMVGDGTQSRDFVYVTDVADAFVKAAESNISGEVFNVSGGGPVRISTIAKFFGGKIEYVPWRPGEPRCTHLDISKIMRELKWRPTTDLNIGMTMVIAEIERWLDAPVWNKESIANATAAWHKHLKVIK